MAGASSSSGKEEGDEREDWFEVMGLGWDATAEDVKDGALLSGVGFGGGLCGPGVCCVLDGVATAMLGYVTVLGWALGGCSLGLLL